ncbi:MAG: SWIM zinc finger family protein [Actinomycetota bacterium]
MSDEQPGRELRRTFSRQAVASLAGRRSYERGLLYAENGRVRKLRAEESSVEATVRGSSSYRVRLWVEDEEPAYECSCPMGDGGAFCKHLVAVALVATGRATVPADEEPSVDLREYLSSFDQAQLVELLLEQAASDELFEARLRMDAARAVADPVAIATFRQAIDQGFVTGDFVDYREMYAYASNVHAVVDALRGLLDDGHADAVVDLTEHALDRAEDAIGYVDDSDGYLGGIAGDLQSLHLEACAVARPDPVHLARRLFDRERHAGDLDTFCGAVATYAEVLGEAGLAEYRRLAQAEWELLPPLAPGDKRTFDYDRFRITHIMETLAEVTGDVDAVVAVLARDQSSAYQFIRIADVYRKAGRYGDALAWLETGLGAFGTQDLRLVDALGEEYHRAGRGAAAVDLCWRAYEPAPSPAGYRRLCDNATTAGSWADWRNRALTALRQSVEARIAEAAKPPSRHPLGAAYYGPRPDASDLVEVFLFEGDVEQAWAEARAAGCSDRWWAELARLREADHPHDAIPIWQRAVERAIGTKTNPGYEEAVELMARVRQLMAVADGPDAFPPYAAKVRAAHKPKRNLMKLLDQRGW